MTGFLLLSSLAALLLTAGAHAQSDLLDPSFGEGGLVTLDVGVGRADEPRAMVAQPDGKVIVVGRPERAQAMIAARYNPDGSLDAAFGRGGSVVVGFSALGWANAVALQPDGKILLAGTSRPATYPALTLVRLRPDGSLDATFGDGGVVSTDFGGTSEAFAVEVGSDGRIVVAGNANDYDDESGDHFALARYLPDGSLDATFGLDGTVSISFDGSNYSDEEFHDVALLSDGRIVAVGQSNRSSGNTIVVRFLADGSLDAAFGEDGVARLSGYYYHYYSGAALALRPDGRLVVTGTVCYGGCGTEGNDYAIRTLGLTPDGAPDPSFSTTTTTIAGDGEAHASSIALQPDGKVVVGGRAATATGYDFAVARYTPEGALDPSFGTEGVVTTDFGGEANGVRDVALLPSGEIVAAGINLEEDEVPGPPYGEQQFALARYSPDGTLDPAFGTDGRVVTPGVGPGDDRAFAMAVQPDGRAVVVGRAWKNGWNVALARFEADGHPDFAFGHGGDGRVLTSFGEHGEGAHAVALQRDGKIVVAGYVAVTPTKPCFAVARYHTNGTLDEDFGTNGLRRVCDGDYSRAYAIALQPDGRILVGGSFSYGFKVARLTPEGHFDSSFGNGGMASTGYIEGYSGPSAAHGLALQPDGKVIAVGTARGELPDSDSARVVVRFDEDGSLDASFGKEGVITHYRGSHYDVEVLPEGRILAAGTRYSHSTPHRPIVAVYTEEGQPWSLFDWGDYEPSANRANALALQPDGHVLVGLSGSSCCYGSGDFVVSRLEEDGSVDTDFGTNGLVRTDFAGSQDDASALHLLPDGRFLAAGTARIDGAGDFALARYLAEPFVATDPALDPSPLRLAAPAPNPARGPTTIRFYLPTAGPARLSIYDVLGRRLAVLADGRRPSGPHEATLDAARLPAGVYLLELRAGDDIQTQRLTVVR